MALIALIDYGMGNLGSVEKALAAVGCEVVITDQPRVLEEAAGLVLPGVGAWDDCIGSLESHGLVGPLKELVAAGKPFLGICLGLQMLFESSEEGTLPGLSFFPGRVERFRHELKIPQIGWNQVVLKQDMPYFAGVPDASWFYFVHSYYVVPDDPSIIATTTDYGYEFCSAIWKDNVFACQYHPEKSQDVGLKVLNNFRGLTEG
jgi:glutamine amidotransferase